MQNTRLEWKPLGKVARIFRGTVSSAPRPKGVVHSTDYRRGTWQRPHDVSAVDASRGQIRFDDLLIRRVGRNSHVTLGDARLVAGCLATDCVFVIRPNADIASVNLAFAIKAIAGLHCTPHLLERGTGARYFCKSSLEQLPVPLAASTVYSDSFRAFLLAYAEECVDCASAAVSKVTRCLAQSSEERRIRPPQSCNQCPSSQQGVPPIDVRSTPQPPSVRGAAL